MGPILLENESTVDLLKICFSIDWIRAEYSTNINSAFSVQTSLSKVSEW